MSWSRGVRCLGRVACDVLVAWHVMSWLRVRGGTAARLGVEPLAFVPDGAVRFAPLVALELPARAAAATRWVLGGGGVTGYAHASQRARSTPRTCGVCRLWLCACACARACGMWHVAGGMCVWLCMWTCACRWHVRARVHVACACARA
eukprot:2139081-Prymnesium_polylepis.1